MKNLLWNLSCSRLFSGSPIWLSTHTLDSEKQAGRAADSTGNLSIRVANCEQLGHLAGAWCPLGWPASSESRLHDSENAPLSWGERCRRGGTHPTATQPVQTSLTRSQPLPPQPCRSLFPVPSPRSSLFWVNTPAPAERA